MKIGAFHIAVHLWCIMIIHHKCTAMSMIMTTMTFDIFTARQIA